MGVGSGTVDRPLLVAMKNVPAPLASAVSSLAVDGEQLLHAGDEICLRGLQKDMEVIAHERPRMDLPPMARINLAEPVENLLMVVLGDKHGISPVAAGHHMVNRARILKARLSGHAQGWSVPLIPAKILLLREQRPHLRPIYLLREICAVSGKIENMGYKLTNNIGYTFLFVRLRRGARQNPS